MQDVMRQRPYSSLWLAVCALSLSLILLALTSTREGRLHEYPVIKSTDLLGGATLNKAKYAAERELADIQVIQQCSLD